MHRKKAEKSSETSNLMARKHEFRESKKIKLRAQDKVKQCGD